MFTGIIRELGTIERVERANGLVRFAVYAPKIAPRLEPMESVAVDGVCVTAVAIRRRAIVFEVIPETQRLTTLGGLRSGSRVHLEPSLSLVDRLGGQLLLGHVDGLGTVVTRRQRAGEQVVDIRVPPRLRTFLVPKGPVAINGVSLTIGGVVGSMFAVHLIPETLRRTTLGSLEAGDRVNVELDYVAKLVHHFCAGRRLPMG